MMTNIPIQKLMSEEFTIERSECGEEIFVTISNSIVKLHISFSSRDLYRYLSNTEVEAAVRMEMRKGND